MFVILELAGLEAHHDAGHKPLIVGTNGSPGSLRALRYGEFLARTHQAVLMPVIAWEPPGGERAERITPSGRCRRQSGTRPASG